MIYLFGPKEEEVADLAPEAKEGAGFQFAAASEVPQGGFAF